MMITIPCAVRAPGAKSLPGRVSSLAVVGAIAAGSIARAQCPTDWQPGEGVPGVVGIGTVFAATTWDPDGPGPQPALVVFGGTFVGAGDLAVSSIAAWDASAGQWQALGGGLNAQVRDLAVYDGELIAAAGHNGFGNPGPANGVARFDAASQTWQPLGAAGFQNVVWALAAFNGEVYAGGLFTSAGGTPVNNIARWNSTSWQPVGAGIAGGVTASPSSMASCSRPATASCAGPGRPGNHLAPA